MAPRANHDDWKDAIERVEETAKEAKEDNRESIADLWTEINKLRDRVHAIERWQSLCYGVVGVGGVLGGYLLNKLDKLLTQ